VKADRKTAAQITAGAVDKKYQAFKEEVKEKAPDND